jgi:phage-related protein
VAIAQQLRGLYGDDIPKALASTQASALRLNEATKEVANTISNNLTSSLADVIDGTKTAGQAFQDFSKIVVRAIEEAIIKLLIVGPLMRGLQGGLGGLFGVGSIAGAVGPTSLGGAPLIGAFADGTNSAPGGLARINEQGGEIVNLPNGAQVIPHDVSMALARRGGGGGAFAPVYNIDARGSTMTESQFRAILADNNRHVLRQANASVPGIVAQSQLRAG